MFKPTMASLRNSKHGVTDPIITISLRVFDRRNTIYIQAGVLLPDRRIKWIY